MTKYVKCITMTAFGLTFGKTYPVAEEKSTHYQILSDTGFYFHYPHSYFEEIPEEINNKITLKVGDSLSILKKWNHLPSNLIAGFINGKPVDTRGVNWSMELDHYYVNGVKYARDDIIIPDDNTTASNSVAVPESASGTIKIDVKPTEILSPSQPNMRVGGWVKAINDFHGELVVGKWYQIIETHKLHSLSFTVNTCDSTYGFNADKFASFYFDCDNALPCHPDDYKISGIKVIHSFDKTDSDKFNALIKGDTIVPSEPCMDDNNLPYFNEMSDDMADRVGTAMRESLSSLGVNQSVEVTDMINSDWLTMAQIDQPVEVNDMVNNPPHYNQFPMQVKDWNFAVIETITDKHYAAYFKTVSEYLHRAHLKNGVEDLEKAVFWLQDCIKHVKAKQMEIK